MERSAMDTGEPVRATVAARLGGGAGFLSIDPCLPTAALGTQSGSESGEKGLDLRRGFGTKPSLGGCIVAFPGAPVIC